MTSGNLGEDIWKCMKKKDLIAKYIERDYKSIKSNWNMNK